MAAVCSKMETANTLKDGTARHHWHFHHGIRRSAQPGRKDRHNVNHHLRAQSGMWTMITLTGVYVILGIGLTLLECLAGDARIVESELSVAQCVPLNQIRAFLKSNEEIEI